MKTKSLGYSDERGGIPLRPWPRGLREGDGFDWDVTRPLAEQWPWNGEPIDERERKAAVIDEPILTNDETVEIIAKSSDSYMPVETEHADIIDGIKTLSPVTPVKHREGWQDGVVDEIAAAPRVAVSVATGPEPEHGVEVAPVDCPREECVEGCTAAYGACVVETEEPPK